MDNILGNNLMQVLMNIENFPLLVNVPIDYNDTMPPETLCKIAQKFISRMDYDNARICLSIAIEKNHTPSMIQLGRFYELVEINPEEMSRLYNLAIENNDKDGAYAFAVYYKKINNEAKMIEYLIVGAERFNDPTSIYNLITYYLEKLDKDNCLKYCNKLIKLDPNTGHYMIGFAFEKFIMIDEMKIHYTMFLNNLEAKSIEFHEEKDKILDVIRLFLQNEIELPFIQTMLHKFNITDASILGHLQFKINKTKLSNYKISGDCMICYETTDLQLFDCLGHHYCIGCNIKLEKCAVCKCSRKCLH